MYEYRWTEVAAGDGHDDHLTRFGAEGWEAVGMTVIGQHFGETYVRILLKRAVASAAPALVDVSAYERRRGDRRQTPTYGSATG